MNDIELVSDGEGIAVIGNPSDVDRFFLQSGLETLPSRDLDLHKIRSVSNTAGAAVQVGADAAANSGRWIKLTKESADAVRKYGLMASENPGISHVMIGQPGNIGRWVQTAQKSTALFGGPFALTALSTMMQQQAMQQQMDEIAQYLEVINEKVDDILRGQKDAVFADMIGVDLIVEDALTVRNEVGRVSDVTWSKVQATSQTIARTQAYVLRELDGIAEKLQKKRDVGAIARATREAEPKVREWLAVLARTFQLQDGISVLELDRVLDSSPEDLEPHRIGLAKARQNRLDSIGSATAALLAQMDETVSKANAKVLLNPFDSPAAVKSSNKVAAEVHSFRGRLGVEAHRQEEDARKWGRAASEFLETVRDGTVEGAGNVKRGGEQVFERATSIFRPVDLDGDGVPDQPRASAAAEQAGEALKGAAVGVAGAFGTLFQRRKPKAEEETAEEVDGEDPDA